MHGESLICSCGDAIHIDQDGTRTTCYDATPHLDHSAFQAWAQRWGFTPGSLGWLPEVLGYPHSIRVQLVSDHLLWRCGLLPGIDWSQFPSWSGRGTTTGDAQPLSGFSAEHPWELLPPDDDEDAKPPPEPPELAETPRKGLFGGGDTERTSPGPSVVKRFGGVQTKTTPAKTASKRWGQ